MNKVIFKLKYGDFPDCINETKSEILNFTIYNLYWELNYIYFDDIYPGGYAIKYTNNDTENLFNDREIVLEELGLS
jgi:hypothetical protein